MIMGQVLSEWLFCYCQGEVYERLLRFYYVGRFLFWKLTDLYINPSLSQQ